MPRASASTITNRNTKAGPRSGVNSELEGAALGIVYALGPLSPYAVLAEFARSPSSYWSASAGSVYPVIQRLVRRGLVSVKRRSRGSRSAGTCTITARGKRALVRWIGPPWTFPVEATTFDPIRTRVSFLAALRPAMRVRFLREAEARLREELRRVRAIVEAERRRGDLWESLATLGNLEELRGRIRWVRAILRQVQPSRKGRRGSRARTR